MKPAVKISTGGNDLESYINGTVDRDRITFGKPVLMATVITRYCWSSPRGNSSNIESNKSSLPLKIVSRNFTDCMKWLHFVLLR